MEDIKLDQFNFPTFYPGQTVVCIDGFPKTGFEKDKEYIVSSYEYKMNPVNGLWFWYIGIVGYHEWLRPSIFAPIIHPVQNVTFEKISTDIPISIN
jgi:hypothetical protein